MKKIYIVIIVVFMALNSFDRPASKDAKAIFDNPVIRNQAYNGDLYLKGLFAPEDMPPEDYAQYLIGAQLNDPRGLDEILESTEKNRAPNELKLVDDNIDLNCWLEENENKACADEKTLRQAIDKNEILLERMQNLSNYFYFDQNYTALLSQPSDFIKLNDLQLAQIVLMNENNEKAALPLLLGNIQTQQNILSGRQNLVTKAIASIMLSKGLTTLERITRNKPELIKSNFIYIENILQREAFGEDGFNIKKTAQADYNSTVGLLMHHMDNASINQKLSHYTFFKPQDTKNQYAEAMSTMISIFKEPNIAWLNQYQAFKKKQQKGFTLSSILYNQVGNLLLPGMAKGSELFLNRKAISHPKQTMLLLCLKARKDGIKDQDMQSFIETAGKPFLNPVTREPYKWNKDEKIIYFSAPEVLDNEVSMSCQ